ncbi:MULTISPECIES: dolichyl-phosphate beta-glucosyltransferase [Actinoplanes]|uniref:dolichyl-phosphate beta-glucosyltransferase n=1 Tax=Actinoplanes TaxID=1865 RepID=UPI0005F27B68|nr:MULTISPECIES: dolichyl-phosphate beta-glucosyltransferase [Actinoplanes]GLX99842.1 glycosyl transferase [Actinoplanes sp. NBRC 101535]
MSLDAYTAYRTWAAEEISHPPRVSVVIPAYNEEERIIPTIGAIATHMSARGEPWELIVADDGSTDTTVSLLQTMNLANMRVLVAERNGGKGSAVRRGVLAARGEIVLFADADQSTPIEQFDHLLNRITHEGYDIVIGSRHAAGASVANKSMVRKMLSGGLRFVVRTLGGLTITDTQCGFKLFTAPAARSLFTRQIIDGFSFDLEVLYLANKTQMRVAEVPVEWIDAPGSTVRPLKVTLQFLQELIRVRLNDLRGRYAHHRSGAGIPAQTIR